MIKKFVLGEYQVNCYVVYNNNEAIVIDPGYESKDIVSFINDNNLNLKYIINTHGHFDHTGGIYFLKKHFPKAIFAVYEKETIWYSDDFNINLTGSIIPYDMTYNINHIFKLGDEKITCFSSPGHSKGSIMFTYKNYLFTGDTLFFGSIGRTDFYEGSFDEEYNSIQNAYKKFPDDTICLPGHGPKTTIGFEKLHNSFVRG